MNPFSTLRLSALLLFLGCSSGTSSPTDVATTFFDAMLAERLDLAYATLTPEARALVSGEDGFSFDGSSIDSFRLGSESVDGETAEVGVTLVKLGDEQSASLLLRQAEGTWAVYGVRVPFGDSALTLDFESDSGPLSGAGGELATAIGEGIADEMQAAFAEWEQTMAQGGTLEEIAAERARFVGLTAVRPDAYAQAWRIDFDAQQQPALDLITQLLEDSGIVIDAGAAAEALARPVDLELAGVSRIEAVERVAAAAGVSPVWPTGNTFGDELHALTFEPGERTRPFAFTGPFLVEIPELTEEAPNAVGSMTVAVRALGLGAAALAFQTEMVELLRLERVRGPRDQPLVDENMHHMGTPQVTGDYLTYSIDKDLKTLLRDVEHVDVVGEVRFDLPASVDEVAWTRGEAGPVTVGAGQLSLRSWDESVQFQYTLPDGGDVEGVQVRLSPRKASGDPLGVLFSTSGGWGSELSANVDCPEPPAAVDVKVCRIESIAYAFELPAIPLAHFADQPTELEALRFDGVAPLALQVGRVDRSDPQNPELTLTARNTSNKAVRQFVVDFVYYDAAGNELDDFPHTFSGDWDFETGRTAVAIAAGENREFTSHVAFAPEGMVTVKLRLREVAFPDGTTWPSDAL